MRHRTRGVTTLAYRKESSLLGLFLDYEKPVDGEPVENGLDPLIVFGNRTVPHEGGELVYNPRPTSVQCLYFRAGTVMSEPARNPTVRVCRHSHL